MGKFIDLTGMTFDKLTVIKRVDNYISSNEKRFVYWECRCECGNIVVVRGNDLKSKKTKSCGCLRSKQNDYNLTGPYGIGYTFKGEEFWFDLEDYDKIKEYCWHINPDGYVCTRVLNKTLFLHRLIILPSDGMEIDHIDHNKFDNRKKNLRIVTHYQNCLNKGKYRSNTSGNTGVYLRKDRNIWKSYITVNKKRIHLGYFEDKEDAIKARKEAEEKYFGEYSYDNRMKGDENNEQKSQI